ncbi:hypothetical protein L2719_17680 [Shewanella schlegeliana]|uniref:QueD-like protein n=1 Tax=Shewanella schlegeliana TaxID=190308 RepID=A0ABS1SU41_9GAMM|nr:VC2046/SO_2500 family protein [Shewanella schlegeliana]MBL4912038.1 hypothetical protein [Shewanella schlegeliana]MCL1111365.1 hypothetical protein [Shewanella schlegeliana]GIU33174.1 queD-like protein [Shewanella schlegeliana]
MGISQLESTLINESQLGSRLNHAVGSNRRGEFGLLLSMLSEDARDMAQFQTAAHLSHDLRAKFELPTPQALVEQLNSDLMVTDNSQVHQENGAIAFRLANVLNEEALVIRHNESLEMQEVLANCALSVRQRYSQVSVAPKVELTHFVDQLVMQRQMGELIAQA